MRYRILTTTQALRDDGTAVTLGGARLRALLTVLALRVGRTVPSGVLVDEVWGDEPPADASGALQALVARLRRTLGHSAVASVDGGYRLCAEADDVDLYRFDRLAGRAPEHWTRATRRRPRACWRTRWRCGGARSSPTSRTARPRRPAGRPGTWTPAGSR